MIQQPNPASMTGVVNDNILDVDPESWEITHALHDAYTIYCFKLNYYYSHRVFDHTHASRAC